MSGSIVVFQCFNCGRPESEAPLVALRSAGKALWICPQCLPVLIHHPEQLKDTSSPDQPAQRPGGGAG